ncbi:right-handed parallel beta-helix repeat-containing protein [Nonomuraea typhae]|uniref:right-handed parallel beta-helix repeat-containing protein n=1 Tax=Nonomuraea typhae TaxID=2603600 RepID=UPI0012FA0A9E|nr:right-handed parallel beta-helix repeat-containing protein [Nonomuraea typhae]
MELTRRGLLAAGGALAVAAAGARPAQASTLWQSSLVRYDRRGRLAYTADAEGNRIPDFSHAGYRNGERPLPHVRTVKVIRPVEGDNTAHIQAALDEVAALPRERRGALLLLPGLYPVAGTVYVRADGLVLRGTGDGDDPAANTIIKATGNTPANRNVIVVGGAAGGGWRGEVPGTRTEITTDVVQVGAREFQVADPGALRPGDNIVITHPCTEEWLKAIDHGGHDVGPPWKPGEHPIPYNRYVRDVTGTTVTVDVPVFNHLDRAHGPSFLYTWDRAGLVTEAGVERLRVDIEYTGDPDQDENHAYNAIYLLRCEDAWVRDCTALHFTQAGFATQETTRATIQNCRALDPVSQITGSRRYNFNTYTYSQQVLFKDCHASKARHAFVSNGHSTVSGVVFLRGLAEHALNSSEGHRRWTQGLLFDGHRDVDPHYDYTLGLYNRGRYGTSHGWSAAHSVAWNCDVSTSRLIVQKPPTAQNHAIGCKGTITGDGPFAQPAGFIEGANRPGLFPPSLYQAQYFDRHR